MKKVFWYILFIITPIYCFSYKNRSSYVDIMDKVKKNAEHNYKNPYLSKIHFCEYAFNAPSNEILQLYDIWGIDTNIGFNGYKFEPNTKPVLRYLISANRYEKYPNTDYGTGIQQRDHDSGLTAFSFYVHNYIESVIADIIVKRRMLNLMPNTDFKTKDHNLKKVVIGDGPWWETECIKLENTATDTTYKGLQCFKLITIGENLNTVAEKFKNIDDYVKWDSTYIKYSQVIIVNKKDYAILDIETKIVDNIKSITLNHYHKEVYEKYDNEFYYQTLFVSKEPRYEYGAARYKSPDLYTLFIKRTSIEKDKNITKELEPFPFKPYRDFCNDVKCIETSLQNDFNLFAL